MTVHVNKKPTILTANGTTSVPGVWTPGNESNTDGFQIYNSDTTNRCFVRSGIGAQTAVATDQVIPPGATKVFRKNPSDTDFAIIMSAASTAPIYVTPCNAFETMQ